MEKTTYENLTFGIDTAHFILLLGIIITLNILVYITFKVIKKFKDEGFNSLTKKIKKNKFVELKLEDIIEFSEEHKKTKEEEEGKQLFETFEKKYNNHINKDKCEYENLLLVNLLNDLRRSSERHRYFGLVLSVLLVGCIVIQMSLINFCFIPDQAELIRTSKNNVSYLTLYYLVRAFLVGSFFSASIFFIFKLAKGSFDQSVRYRKRLDSLYFLKYILVSNDISTTDLKLSNSKELISIYNAWLKSVDTAFSENSKYIKKHKIKAKNGNEAINLSDEINTN